MIVVTGGSGFIGTHLCQRLEEDGYKVRILDIVPPQSGIRGEFVRASVLDAGRLQKLFNGAEAVVHLAALIDVAASVSDPYADFSVNAAGTLNVLETARRAGVKRVAFASSAAVYGEPVRLPVDEEHPTAPLSPYGASKLSAERYVLLYNRLYGMENAALRLFNVYGSGQNPLSPYSGVITKFANAIRDGKRPIIYGDGSQTRDFVHVDDVCEAFVRAIECGGKDMPCNIASATETTLLELMEEMCNIADVPADPEFLPAREGDIKRSVADIALAKKTLGFSPKISLARGLGGIVGKRK
ncbi:MAG: NAD-dependent epimerase/dehydratase family protein [Candidatus Micrarchaeota archaeon]|nr:NAD-dependent epimerase/dehydratase family protein [Candidatus Micrarchaeota archaeon]